MELFNEFRTIIEWAEGRFIMVPQKFGINCDRLPCVSQSKCPLWNDIMFPIVCVTKFVVEFHQILQNLRVSWPKKTWQILLCSVENPPFPPIFPWKITAEAGELQLPRGTNLHPPGRSSISAVAAVDAAPWSGSCDAWAAGLQSEESTDRRHVKYREGKSEYIKFMLLKIYSYFLRFMRY